MEVKRSSGLSLASRYVEHLSGRSDETRERTEALLDSPRGEEAKGPLVEPREAAEQSAFPSLSSV
jgi:hypothetical protein